ncbi:hypothetical protein SAMN06297251_10174 [Fulvimarina manganoxydans]|uniref:Uncharacterized protein n=1 Tax=Fulvimarina manganoxydans TaxID=937218 RepID=A0A1W1Y982_9HYPH|nr:hypothetical protein [Fulvimarina manganoxydans]SMC32699.1 hypothetical protein SAMN06297251_10174 [Fulvimarina manganoxydans]
MTLPPLRAHHLVLDVQADDAESLARSLETIAFEIRTGRLTIGMSGGHDSGWMHSYAVDGTRTHADWARELDRWLAERNVEDA